MNLEEYPPIIIVCDGDIIYAGIAGDDYPRSAFRSVIGRLASGLSFGSADKDYYVGEEALAKKDYLGVLKHLTEQWSIKCYGCLRPVNNP